MPDLPIRDRLINPDFRRAVDLIDSGDAEALAVHLAHHPELINLRVRIDDSGYFAEPGLLNFVAGNPIRQDRLPATIVEVTTVILDAGADQDGGACTCTLGLIATGCRPREAGVQIPLLQLLLDRGTEIGDALSAALAHHEMDAARFLRQSKASLTLWEAAGFGELESLTLQLRESPDPLDLRKAMALAALHNQAAALELLCAAGAEVNAYNPEGFHAHSTPLHQAALAGHREAVDILLAHGARIDLPDRFFGGTAPGWAEHNGHHALGQHIRSQGDIP